MNDPSVDYLDCLSIDHLSVPKCESLALGAGFGFRKLCWMGFVFVYRFRFSKSLGLVLSKRVMFSLRCF